MAAVEDLVQVQQLLAAYVFIMDDADWSRLGDVLTPDVEFDFTDFGLPSLHGLAEVHRQFSSMKHPIAHHALNTLVSDRGDELHLRSKMIMAMGGHRTWFGEYHDVVVRTPAGLRFSRRIGVRPQSLRKAAS